MASAAERTRSETINVKKVLIHALITESDAEGMSSGKESELD